jgi:hypothetical protein
MIQLLGDGFLLCRSGIERWAALWVTVPAQIFPGAAALEVP